MLIRIQPDVTVCRYLFISKSLYMFRVSRHPSSGVLKTVTATSGTGHNTGTATSLERGPIGPCWKEVAYCILLHLVGFLLTWLYVLTNKTGMTLLKAICGLSNDTVITLSLRTADC